MYDNNTTNCKRNGDDILSDIISFIIWWYFWTAVLTALGYLIAALWRYIIVPLRRGIWCLVVLLIKEVLIPIGNDLVHLFFQLTTWIVQISRTTEQLIDRQLTSD